jgi:hypothetical protein
MELTEEQQKDVDARIEEFVKRHQKDVEELQVDFASSMQTVQIAPGIYANTIVVTPLDKKYRSVPSPISKEIIEK